MDSHVRTRPQTFATGQQFQSTPTQDNPELMTVDDRQPDFGRLAALLPQLLERLAVHLQRVLVGESARGIDVDARLARADLELLPPDELEHPIPS